MSAHHEHLRIDVHFEGGVPILALDGELDPHTVPLLQREFDRVVGMGTTQVVFDLDRLRFIDSSGLRVLLLAHRTLSERGGDMVLTRPSEAVSRLLDITGLDAHLKVEAVK